MASVDREELDVVPSNPRRRWVLLILVGLVCAAPFAFEGVQVLTARWQGLVGDPPYVPTPATDWASGLLGDCGLWFRRQTKSLLRDTAWRPAHIILFFGAWTVAAGLMLRGFRR
jgi:hypothetical protein